MPGPLDRLNPFKSADARRLAILFAVVYFSQGMYHVADQVLTLTLKERLGMSPSQVGKFGTIILLPWVIKPLYGMISDSFPLFGTRRKSYFLLTSALATLAGIALGLVGEPTYSKLAVFMLIMGLGIAFTDVLTDAMMVENGKPLGLTGAFQSVQWTAINVAILLVGIVGGYLAQHRLLQAGFLIAACFPFLALVMGVAAYAPLSRRVSLHRIIVLATAVSTVGTLAYLFYNDRRSAIAIDTVFGGIGMITQLAFLDLAAKACPRHAEGTFFALLMSVYNLGVQGSQVFGGYLYEWTSYSTLVWISAAMTAAAYFLLPLVDIPAIERRARAAGPPPEIR